MENNFKKQIILDLTESLANNVCGLCEVAEPEDK